MSIHGHEQLSTAELVSIAHTTPLPKHGGRIEVWDVRGKDSPDIAGSDFVRFPVPCSGSSSIPQDISQFSGGGIIASCGTCDVPFVFVARTQSWSRT